MAHIIHLCIILLAAKNSCIPSGEIMQDLAGTRTSEGCAKYGSGCYVDKRICTWKIQAAHEHEVSVKTILNDERDNFHLDFSSKERNKVKNIFFYHVWIVVFFTTELK